MTAVEIKSNTEAKDFKEIKSQIAKLKDEIQRTVKSSVFNDISIRLKSVEDVIKELENGSEHEGVFVEIYHRFETLTDPKSEKRISGLEAEIRRATDPDNLAEKLLFYRLMNKTTLGTNEKGQRIAFFLPYVKHSKTADSLGKQLADAGISEMRLFQVLRSEEPNDLIQLRRLIEQIKPSLNWQDFGKMLYYWNKEQKRRLLEDYFINSKTDTKKSSDK